MPIFIDNRGSGEEELYNLLKSKHLAVEHKHIDSGDIVFGIDGDMVGIERKTVNDLIKSVVGSKKYPASRHFWDQIKVLKATYKTPLVIIEGTIDFKDKLVSGILFGLLLGWKIPYINTYNVYDTAEAVSRMFTRYGENKAKGYPPAAVRKEASPTKIRWAMLQCCKGIGPATATKILKSIDYKELFRGDVTSKKLCKVVNAKIAKRLEDAFK